MERELVFTVDSGVANAATPISFIEAGLREREHLQEWILAHPEILGTDLRIISFEFGRWEAFDRVPTYDRLDVLAINRSGRLMVAELKRDRAPDTVTMQALNYAAMVSRFSVDTLTEVYARHHAADGFDTEQAHAGLTEWAPELSDETLGPPGIVLVATDFSPQVTNTALFLYENGIDIRLVQARLYRTTSREIVLTTSQLLPVPAAETFMVRPRSTPGTQTATRIARERRASIPERLVTHAVFAQGEQLRITVPTGTAEDRDKIEEWLNEDPQRTTVSWSQDARAPVIWAVDGQSYNLTTLIRRIIKSSTGNPPRTQTWGPNWYRDTADRVLYKIAETLPDD